MDSTTNLSDIPSMFEAFNMFKTPELAEKFLCGKKTCRAKEIVRDCTRQNQIEMYLKLMPSIKVMLKSEARDNCRNRRIQI
uniref:Uncharacterized protein n=1 Tax=Strongyloides venezuelensis TaxID=75913 RepID=A0A0K0G392_STRVS